MACCFGRRKKPSRQDEDTLVESSSGMRKLTIDHGRVVTAPSSPRWPVSIYSTASNRNSQATTVEKHHSFEATRPPTTTSSVIPGPPSPTFSFAPSVVRQAQAAAAGYGETGSTRRTSIVRKPALETMAENPMADAASSIYSQPSSYAKDNQTDLPDGLTSAKPSVLSEKSPNGSMRTLEPMRSPKPTLSAISNAALGLDEKHLAPPSAVEKLKKTRPNVSRMNSAPTAVKQPKTSDVPLPLRVSMPPEAMKAAAPAVNRSKSVESPKIDASSSGGKRARKHRPPPITTSTAPPKIPTTFLKASSANSSALPSPATTQHKDLPSPPKTPSESKERQGRQSVFSFTSSQYSPTASIRGVDQVQMVQAPRIQQVNARNNGGKLPPTTGTRLTDIIASPAVKASPRALYPPNYPGSAKSSHAQTASLASVVAGKPATPSSHKSPVPDKSGFVTAPTSAASPRSGGLAAAPGSPEVPLTSASLTFPPNFPDYSYSPVGQPLNQALPPRKSSKGSVHSEGCSTLPEVVTEEPSEVHELDGGDVAKIKNVRAGHRRSKSLGMIEISLKDVGLKGTATVTISELAGLADLQKTRRTMAAGR